MNDRAILKNIKKPVSGTELKDMLNDTVDVVLYKDLIMYDSIDELFKKNDSIALLYEFKPNYGHWVGLIHQPQYNRIEFFCSYGIPVDGHKKYIPSNYIDVSGQRPNYLSSLLSKSSKEIHYNEIQMQMRSNMISTCGRHIAVRILWKHIPLEKYQSIMLMNGKHGSDYLVTYITTYI